MAVQMADGAVFAAPAHTIIAEQQKANAAAADLAPAPVPDPDLQPPTGDAEPAAHLMPSLISRPSLVGNGVAQAATRDHGLEEKEQPAAGLQLSVPVVQ